MTRFKFSPGLGRLALAALVLIPALASADADPQWLQGVDELRVERPAGAAGAILRLSGPGGLFREVVFGAEEAIELDETQLVELTRLEGDYVWEVHFQRVVSRSRIEGADDESVPGVIQPVSGSLRKVDGAIHVGRATDSPVLEESDRAGPRDVIDGDLTVNGSACVGDDCAAAESYGFDTLRLKENNLRIHFDDTSATQSYAANDWSLLANGSENGGANMFAIQDRTAGRNLMTLSAGAPANSLFMSGAGDVGLGTATPATELHVADGDTPTVRLDQTNASGFTPQVWDMAGNEANFFIRDLTGGSNLVFRLVPGAPENSIYVAPSGNVGLGTATPQARLHVADGDLRVDGSVYQLSSRAVKTDFVGMEPGRLLRLVGGLDLGIWRYRSGSDRGQHFGPAAEDFHAAFGLGETSDRISLSDMAGIALGATQALKLELEEKDREIESLRERLERLEQALLADRTER